MNSRPKRLLLVDDDPKLGMQLRDFFQTRDIEVDVAPDGPRGLAKALVGGYDVVLVDVVLPGFDGFSLLESLRRQSPVPVVMLTAPLKESGGRGSLPRADAYLPKPFRPEQLLDRVKAVLNGR